MLDKYARFIRGLSWPVMILGFPLWFLLAFPIGALAIIQMAAYAAADKAFRPGVGRSTARWCGTAAGWLIAGGAGLAVIGLPDALGFALVAFGLASFLPIVPFAAARAVGWGGNKKKSNS